AGHAKTLAEPLPYRNFVAATLAAPEAEHDAFFRSMLTDVEEPSAAFGLQDVQSDGAAVDEATLPLPPGLAARIREASRRHGVTPSILFHVAWAQVLAKSSGRDDVVFGTVLSGRLQGTAGADRVLGMFINTLPIRVKLA